MDWIYNKHEDICYNYDIWNTRIAM